MSEVGGIINFLIFDFIHPFREEIGTRVRYIHEEARAKCTRNYVQRREIARVVFFSKLGDAGKLFVPVLNFSANTNFFRRILIFFGEKTHVAKKNWGVRGGKTRAFQSLENSSHK